MLECARPSRRSPRGALRAVLLAAGVLLAAPAFASALCTPTVHTVTTFADVNNSGDGVLSLREAFSASVAGTYLCDEIRLPAGRYTVGAPAIVMPDEQHVNLRPDSDTATARDVTIDASGGPLFTVAASAQLSVSQITITNSSRAFDNAGTLNVYNSALSGNGGTISGPALHNAAGAHAVVQQSTGADNRNHATIGGGGAIANDGVLQLDESTLVGNSTGFIAGNGGALAVTSGSDTVLLHDTIDRNSVPAADGGLFGGG